MAPLTTFERKCAALLKRHDYIFYFNVDGTGKLAQCEIRGFCSENILPWKFNNIFQAVEHLLPICGAEYHADYDRTFTVNA